MDDGVSAADDRLTVVPEGDNLGRTAERREDHVEAELADHDGCGEPHRGQRAADQGDRHDRAEEECEQQANGARRAVARERVGCGGEQCRGGSGEQTAQHA